MRWDWNALGGLPKILRDGGVDATGMVDARRDAADEIDRLRKALKFYAEATTKDWENDNGFTANAALAE